MRGVGLLEAHSKINMDKDKLVFAGEDPNKYSREQVGGKGLNLLKLHQFAQQTGKVVVPDFFIIPRDYSYSVCSDIDDSYLIFKDESIVEKEFEKLRKPVIARSSSVAEDGVNATFAGMFLSVPDQNSYPQLISALYKIFFSCWSRDVQKYAERMDIKNYEGMAFIVQEQVADFLFKGVIQLEESEAIIESITKNGKACSLKTEYGFLDERGPFKVYEESHDFISEGEWHNAAQCARDATKFLGLEGIVQVEFLLTPAKKPYFVQIRQLPKIKTHAVELDVEVPKGVPYIESEVCNGVPGDLALPAYVTFSQSGFSSFEIQIGGAVHDERYDSFLEKSKRAGEEEYHSASNAHVSKRFYGVEKCIHYFERIWERGNGLFPEYILVCDKLDESVCKMNSLTSNKKAIITCYEAEKTSHAMIVARDLGIPAMGVDSDHHNFESFFHQVEAGDIVRLKSNGKKAIAYVEKRREKDPYSVHA